jgi:two-component system catabolic regulation response regulator CreB
VPIIFLTARSEEIDRLIGFELGADDYVLKPFSPRELVARVKVRLRSRVEESKPSSPSTEFVVNDDRHLIHFRGESLKLTRYEFRLLKLLIARPGQVFSREQLMNRVWDAPDSSLERTVDAHIKTIRAKLKAIAPEIEPIETVRGVGYCLKDIR